MLWRGSDANVWAEWKQTYRASGVPDEGRERKAGHLWWLLTEITAELNFPAIHGAIFVCRRKDAIVMRWAKRPQSLIESSYMWEKNAHINFRYLGGIAPLEM
jgi:hypothetical protein